MFSAVLAGALGVSASASSAEAFEYSSLAMGSKLRVVIVADDEAAAAESAKAAFIRLQALTLALSDWIPGSELNDVNRAAGRSAVQIGPDLLQALERSLELAGLTDGAFDPTIGPAVAQWREAKKSGQLPAADGLRAATALVGHRGLTVDRPASTARLAREGMRLDLGGIGKGIAVDEIRELLMSRGHAAVLVDFGSAIAAGAAPPDREAWRISMPGFEPIELRNAAVAVSGADEQFITIDTIRYSHIVDPRTGLGLTNGVSAAVIASDATTADALATAACVLGPDRALAIIGSHPALAASIRDGSGEVAIFASTAKFSESGVREPAAKVHIAAGVAAGGAAGVAAGGPEREAITATRRRQGPGRLARLELATIRLTSAGEGVPPLTLMGVAHIGNPAMYEAMQGILDTHEVVLYESVMPAGFPMELRDPPALDGAANVPVEGSDDARATLTRSRMAVVAESLERLRRRSKALPPTLAELGPMLRPIDSRFVQVMPVLSTDAWGRPLFYEPRFDSDGSPIDFVLTSRGADGAEGGKGVDGDITLKRPVASGLEDEGLQADLADALGLAFQLRAIDYSKPNWRLADMDSAELDAALKARGVDAGGFLGTLAGTSFSARMVKLLLGLVRFADGLTGGSIRAMVQVMMIELLSIDGIKDAGAAGMAPGMMEVILDDRNAVVIDRLATLLEREDPKDVAIFYGAAHIPDLVERLRDRFGYEPAGVEWITAIEVDLDKSGVSDTDLAMMRKQIRKMLEAGKRR